MATRPTKEERRDQLIQAAITCFGEKGYYETSMDDIVRQAGLSKGALYWYFKSKRELFSSLIEEWMRDFGESVGARIAKAETANEKLRAVVEATKENAAARPELVRAQLEFYSMAARDEEFQGWLKEMYLENTAFLETVLREAQASGEFRVVPVEAVARMIMAYADGAMLHRDVRDPEVSVGELLDEVFETLMALLKA